ncbi:MAG: hypothetical protein GEV11_03990 [Streptosporangiales bacterium]|nr:hypothetical protein [Streptosporangiales bacterium]
MAKESDSEGVARSARGGSAVRSGIRTLRRRVRRLGVQGWLDSERPFLINLLKVGIACGIAYLLAAHLVHSPKPVLAPLAALLTIQVTLYSTLRRGLELAVGVVAGLFAALWTAQYIGLSAFSIGLMVLLGLLAGRLIGREFIGTQIGINALLVLSLGQGYGLARFEDTLIGGAVGFAVNWLIVPPSFTRTASAGVGDVAEETSDLILRVQAGVRAGWGPGDAQEWLAEARRLSRNMGELADKVEQGEEAARLHPRHSRDIERLDRISEATDCLDHVCHQLRGAIRGISDLAHYDEDERRVRRGTEALPAPLTETLGDIARGVQALGDWHSPTRDEKAVLTRLRQARDAARVDLREARRLALRSAGDPDAGWKDQVLAALVDACRRMTYELDPDRGPHRKAFETDADTAAAPR